MPERLIRQPARKRRIGNPSHPERPGGPRKEMRRGARSTPKCGADERRGGVGARSGVLTGPCRTCRGDAGTPAREWRRHRLREVPAYGLYLRRALPRWSLGPGRASSCGNSGSERRGLVVPCGEPCRRQPIQGRGEERSAARAMSPGARTSTPRMQNSGSR